MNHLLRSYFIGFILSLILTFGAFSAVSAHLPYALPLILVAAVLQMIVQLVCFLHIGSKHTERSYGLALMLAVILIVILVGGTLWIMHNLAHLHMMSPTIDELYVDGTVAPQNELK